jgi:excisionase family DNA binding protein
MDTPAEFPAVGASATGADEHPSAPISTQVPTRLLPDSTSRVVEGVLTVKQVAVALAVSTATVYTLVHRGDLAHLRVLNAIRIPESSLRSVTRSLVNGHRSRKPV